MKRLSTLILLLMGFVCSANLIAQEVIPAKERQALVDLYNNCNGANWKSRYKWDLTTSPSEWKGITIRDGHVVGINLRAASLAGELPESLGDLTELVQVELSSNRISGNIPQGLMKLPKLTYLNLMLQNYDGAPTLKGKLPQEINLPEIQQFVLLGNAISGTLPTQVNMPKVQALLINENELTGPIPDAWSNFPEMVSYSIQDNKFSGNLNINFSKMPHLKEFLCGGISKGNPGLTGTLHESIYNLDLEQLEVQNTGIGGTLKEDIKNWKNMKNLLLFGAKFSGKIPQALSELTSLEIINLAGGNKFEGPLPDLSKLTKLTNLVLSNNSIGGQVPAWVSSLRALKEFRMAHCNLTGSLPADLAPILEADGSDDGKGLLSCFYLDLAGNQLEGQIPERWKGFNKVTTLNLSLNKLSGNPIATILKMSNLNILLLNNNDFSGEIGSLYDRKEIASLSNCNISHNHFSGNIVSKEYFGSEAPFEGFFAGKVNLSHNDFNFKSFQNIGKENMKKNDSGIIYSPMNPIGKESQIVVEDSPKQILMEATTPSPEDINALGTTLENQYQWYRNDQAIQGATKNQYKIDAPKPEHIGVYYCRISNVIAPELQLQTASVILTSRVGATVVEKPNSSWNITSESISYKGASALYVYDLQANLVLSTDRDMLQVEALNHGTYIVVAVVDNQTIATKLVR